MCVCVRVCNDDNTHMTALLSGVGDVLIGYAHTDFFFFFFFLANRSAVTRICQNQHDKLNFTVFNMSL